MDLFQFLTQKPMMKENISAPEVQVKESLDTAASTTEAINKPVDPAQEAHKLFSFVGADAQKLKALMADVKMKETKTQTPVMKKDVVLKALRTLLSSELQPETPTKKTAKTSIEKPCIIDLLPADRLSFDKTTLTGVCQINQGPKKGWCLSFKSAKLTECFSPEGPRTLISNGTYHFTNGLKCKIFRSSITTCISESEEFPLYKYQPKKESKSVEYDALLNFLQGHLNK